MRFFRKKSDAIKICKTETRVIGAPTNIYNMTYIHFLDVFDIFIPARQSSTTVVFPSERERFIIIYFNCLYDCYYC